MIVRFQCDSHYLTCHKKSRLLFVLLTSVRQAVTVHSPVCVVRNSHVVSYLYLMVISNQFLIRTVTCRQFPNLTFAPRKTCHHWQQPHASTLSCHSFFSIYDVIHICKVFLQKIVFFSKQSSHAAISHIGYTSLLVLGCMRSLACGASLLLLFLFPFQLFYIRAEEIHTDFL